MEELEKLSKTIDKLETNSKKLESYENLYDSLNSLKEDIAKNLDALKANKSSVEDMSNQLSKSLESIQMKVNDAINTNIENQKAIKSSLDKVKKQNQSFAEEIEELKQKRKIVCSMMNDSYGFGSFRNKIWLAHSRNLHPSYQKGYHKIFLPLVKFSKGPTFFSRLTKVILEHIARHRTADIWLQKKGKRDLLGMIYRLLIEPICFVCGKCSSD